MAKTLNKFQVYLCHSDEGWHSKLKAVVSLCWHIWIISQSLVNLGYVRNGSYYPSATWAILMLVGAYYIFQVLFQHSWELLNNTGLFSQGIILNWKTLCTWFELSVVTTTKTRLSSEKKAAIVLQALGNWPTMTVHVYDF